MELLSSNIKQEPEVNFLLILPSQEVTSHKKVEIKRSKDTKRANILNCQHCPFIGKDKKALQSHAYMHSLKYSCETCEKKHASSTTLRSHQMYHRHGEYANKPESSFECNECGKCYKSPTHLTAHKIQVHIEAKFHCDICALKTKSKSHLIKHLRTHFRNADDPSLRCELCPFIGKSEATIMRHRIKHTSKYSCETCEKKYGASQYLRSHQMYHRHGEYADKPESSFECKECGKCYKSQEHLKQHKVKVHIEVKFQCDICALKTKLKSHLIKHLKTHFWNADAPSFRCELCPFVGKTKATIMRHRIKHTSKYSCETCEKKHCSLHYLKCHQMYHRHGEYADKPESSFECNECGKCYKSPNHLAAHKIQVHIEAKFQCDICALKTKLKPHLIAHLMTHFRKANDPSLRCELCPFVGKTKAAIMNHRIKHTSKYSCETCEKQHASSSTLRRHQMYHRHGEYVNKPESSFECKE